MKEYLLFLIGFVLLVYGANYLVDGSSKLAKRLGIPTLIIGLTVVAFGTSAPELIVNVFSAFKGITDISLGNIIGSNIANILLVLGVAGLLATLSVRKSTVWNEIPFSFLAAIVLLVVANDFILNGTSTQIITKGEGVIMLLFFGIFLYYVLEQARNKQVELEDPKLKIVNVNYSLITLYIVGGIVGLFLGGQLLIENTLLIARNWGVSNYFMSATIIAVGTSLPELITSIVAVTRRNIDLAIGNIVGSNISNIFFVLGITALIRPIPIPGFANLEIFFLLFITFLLFLFTFISKGRKLLKWQSILFLILYLCYIAFNFYRG